MMRARRWQAWTILAAFTTASVACGGSTEAPSTEAAPPPTQQVAQATPEPPPPPPPPPPAEPAPSPTLPAQPPEQLSKDELRELVAPIALYPDVVLGSLLPATTFPNQLHDAAVYVGNSQQVERVPDGVEWDGSIVGLLQFPDVLRWLDGNPAWTDQMGQAVTYQQGDVLDAIQEYRRLVQKAGNLKSNQYQTVRAARNDDIRIEPARPEIVYVPSYDPVVATQPQPVVATPGINPWLVFGGGAVVGALGAWALYSIFDDDDDVEIHNYYGRGGGGGGWRRIRRYDNYYYARGRRPRRADWVPPRDRPYRHARAESWNRPRRLEHRPVDAGRPARAAALRAPTKPAQKPAQVRRREQRMQRQENQAQKQQRKQEQRTQNQGRKQEQRRQQQERQQSQQRQRQQRQQERRDDRQQQQQQRQQQQQQRRENQREQERQRQENRQMQQQQRRENRAQQQEQRQQKQAERRENQQEQRQQNKKKQNQNQ